MHLVLVNRLVGLSLSSKSVVRLTDPGRKVKKKTSSVLENVVDAPVNLKTKSCQQLLHYDVVSPGLLVARFFKHTLFCKEIRQNNGTDTMCRLSDLDLRACAGSTRREILKHTLFY